MNNDNNNPDKEQVPSVPASATEQAKPTSDAVLPPQQPAKRAGGLLSLLNLILILGLSAAAAWFWLTQWQQHLGSLKNDQQSLQFELGQLNLDLQQQAAANSKLDNLFGTLEGNQQVMQKQLMTIDGRRSHDWVFAESEYLIRLAGRKLWLEQDVATAIALLSSADLRVASLADASLLGLRRALANDIASLKTLPMTDIDGISLALDGIIGQLEQLPINLIELPAALEQEQAELSGSPQDWQQNLGKVWDGLVKDFISVQRRSGEVQPLLSLDQRWYLSANLRLALQQAQLAALQHQGERYQSAVKQARKLLSSYFDQKDVAVQNALTTLTSLANQQVEQRLPADLSSRSLLAELIEKRVKGIPQGTLSLVSPAANQQAATQEAAL